MWGPATRTPRPIELLCAITADHPFWGDAWVVRRTAPCGKVVRCGGCRPAAGVSVRANAERIQGRSYDTGWRKRSNDRGTCGGGGRMGPLRSDHDDGGRVLRVLRGPGRPAERREVLHYGGQLPLRRERHDMGVDRPHR